MTPRRSPLSRRPWHMGTLLEALVVVTIVLLTVAVLFGVGGAW